MPNPSKTFSSAATESNLGANSTIDPQDSSFQLALTIAHAADERKAGEITILRVGDVSPLAEYFVIVTGFSKVQVRAIARTVEEKVDEVFQRRPKRTEGQVEGSWVLADYGDVIFHVMLQQEREFYNLEAFWGHAERISLDALTL